MAGNISVIRPQLITPLFLVLKMNHLYDIILMMGHLYAVTLTMGLSYAHAPNYEASNRWALQYRITKRTVYDGPTAPH